MMSARPTEGIATDAAHSTKSGRTEFQGVDIATGKRLFYRDLGNQTVNIGEFLGVVKAIKYMIEVEYEPRIIYTDSVTAITWVKNQRTASAKTNSEIKKAEVFLRAMASEVEKIEIRHWDNRQWGEIPADFGNK